MRAKKISGIKMPLK